jgi:hypothetical protein
VALAAALLSALPAGAGARTFAVTETPIPEREHFRLIFAEDFAVRARRGTMGSDYDASKVVYAGRSGTRWVTYPSNYVDTYQKRPYRSDRVLSVRGGRLDFWLHKVNGQPAGASISPVINGSQYQTYGRYSVRARVAGRRTRGYHLAWLLWPRDERAWAVAESDFPEFSIHPRLRGIHAFHHFAAGRTEWFYRKLKVRRWHTYTQDWTPLVRRYYVDDVLIGTTINPVWSGPARWELQTETKGNRSHRGHVYVDWAAVFAYAP